MGARIAHRGACIGLVVLALSVISPGAGAAQDQLPPPKSVAPHELIALIEGQVEALAKQQLLQDKERKSLLGRLDDARTSLRQGKLDPAVSWLAHFQREVGSLVKRGALDDKNGALLADEAGVIVSMLLAVLELPAVQLPPPTPCAPQAPCTRLVLHVTAPRGPSTGKPAGTPSAPFPRIADALAYAASHGACGLDIVLGDGTYTENVPVTLPLAIRGAGPDATVIRGSIVNRGAYDLSLSELGILASPDPGAIVVDGACPATTEITRVNISNATGHGVFQRDGTFRALSVAVRGTGIGADPDSGAGIRLVGGVQGVLGDGTLLRNDAGGLAVGGPGTRVYVASVLVDDNHVNEALFAPDGSTGQGGGIEVRDGALLLAEFVNIRHSRVAGLHVASGAQAHYRYGEITNTAWTPAVPFAGGVVVHDATLQASGFTVDRSDLVGVAVLRSAVSLSEGQIAHAPVGASIVEGPDDLLTTPRMCLRDRVEYISVGVPLQAPGGLPCTELAPCPPPPPCVTVPFVCPWCVATVPT